MAAPLTVALARDRPLSSFHFPPGTSFLRGWNWGQAAGRWDNVRPPYGNWYQVPPPIVPGWRGPARPHLLQNSVASNPRVTV
jgi:hypothetical protein